MARDEPTNLGVLGDALGKGTLSETEHADRGELDHLLGQGHQVQDGTEALPLVGPVQGGHDDDLAGGGHGLAEADHVGEELALVDAHHVKVPAVLAAEVRDPLQVAQASDADGFEGLVVVGADAVLVRVPDVLGVLDDQAVALGHLVPLQPSDELGRLSGEHGAEDELRV